MTTKFDRNPHLGDDAAARRMADALDALAAAEIAGSPVGLSDRIARASMPTRSSGLRLAGSAARPWSARLRPVFALAAAVVVVVGGAIYFSTPQASTPTPGPTPGPIAQNDPVTPTPAVSTTPAVESAPQMAIAKASSDVETWLAVGNEMDAMLSSTVADLSATTSDLEERASTAFAADNWYSESSL